MVMTYPIRRMKTCAVCGQEVRVTEIASYSTMGYTLDGRPLTLGADIIPMMIQHCRGCGYCATDIGRPPKDPSIVKDPKYACLGSGRSPATHYEAAGYIKESEGDFEFASFMYLRSAWLLEDHGRNGMAKRLRADALRCFEKVGKEGLQYTLHRMELLRTVGRIDEAKALYDQVRDAPEEYQPFLEHIKGYLDAGSSEPDC